MTAHTPDVNQTLAYSTRAVLLRQLPLALGFALLSLLMYWAGTGKTSFAGLVGLAVAVPWIVIVLVSLALPPKPALTLSPQGLINHRLTHALVPWQDIERVDLTDHEVTQRGTTITIRNIVAVWVSQAVYDRTIHVQSFWRRGPYWDDNFMKWDGRVAIVLNPKSLGVPPEELHAEIEARRLAFHERPRSASAAGPAAGAVARRGGALSAASLAGLRHGAAPAWVWPLAGLFVAGAAVVLANMASLWETEPQRARRQLFEDWAQEERQRAEERRKRDKEFEELFRRMR